MIRATSLSLLVLTAGCATPRAAAPPEEATSPSPAASAPLAQSVPARPLATLPPLHTVLQPVANQPIVSFRLVFRSGAIDDPKGKEGVTALTAKVMSEGGTQSLSAAQLLEALFPMAAELQATTDKELTVFSGRVHKDRLAPFLAIFSDVLLAPRFDPKEFERLKSESVSAIENDLRGQDDETLGKVALDALLYEGHPYGHFNGGTVQALKALTLDDVRAHAAKVFTQDRLIIGLAGAVDASLESQVKSLLAKLPATGAPRVSPLPSASGVQGRTWVLEKDTQSTAISFGASSPLRRGDPDFFAVSLALSYLGEHRQQHGVLFRELRARRGLNYGDYAYAEHFQQDGYSMMPRFNVVRSIQDYSLWLRPVEPANALFATRGALYFLDQLLTQPIATNRFEVSRGSLIGYTRLWEQTDQRRLAAQIDGVLYGIPDYFESYRAALARLTPEEVQAAARRHLSPSKLNFVFVTRDAAGLSAALRQGAPSPISYPSPKEPSVLEEDKRIVVAPLRLDPARVEVKSVKTFMER